jgi:hypothetical protein
MRLTFRKPPPTRAQRLGAAALTAGELIVAVPSGVSSRARSAPSWLRYVAPTAGVMLAAALLARRRRSRAAIEDWSGAEPVAPPSPPATETERRKEDVVGGSGDGATAEGVAEAPQAGDADAPTSAEATPEGDGA